MRRASRSTSPDRSRIVDQGTAFSVHIDDEGRSTLRVTEGAVDWRSADENADPIRIVAGQNARIVGDQLVVDRVIYRDDFDGQGVLSGQSPDVRPGDETWIASEQSPRRGKPTDRSQPQTPSRTAPRFCRSRLKRAASTRFRSTWIPSAMCQSGSRWGFTDGADTTADFYKQPNASIAWVLERADRSNSTVFLGPGIDQKLATIVSNGGVKTLRIVLDTRGDDWSAEFYRDDVLFARFRRPSRPVPRSTTLPSRDTTTSAGASTTSR